jgi:hypothetical protein
VEAVVVVAADGVRTAGAAEVGVAGAAAGTDPMTDGSIPSGTANPSESLRMLIFLELVQAQDQGVSVADSRRDAATRHQLTVEQIREIEKEGLAKGWAPL